MEEYLPLLEEELALRGDDRRAPQWRKADVAPDVDFRVVDHRRGHVRACSPHTGSHQAGVDVRDRSRRTTTSVAPGSRTRYPGCRVDNPNHNYSYSFAQRHDWPLHFSTQDVLLDYFRRCADAFGLRERIRFGTEVRVGHLVRHGTARGRWSRAHRRRAPRTPSSRTRSSARSASSTGRASPTSRVATRSPAPPSTRPRGTTTSTSRRQARRGDRHRRERGAVHPRDRARASASSSSSSGRRRGWARPPTTTTRSPPGCAGCTHTSRRTASGTASGSSGDGRRRAAGRAGRSRVGAEGRRRSASINDIMRTMLTAYLEQQFARPARPARRRSSRPTRPAPSASSATTASGPATLKRDNVAARHRDRSARSRRRASSPPTASSTTST